MDEYTQRIRCMWACLSVIVAGLTIPLWLAVPADHYANQPAACGSDAECAELCDADDAECDGGPQS